MPEVGSVRNATCRESEAHTPALNNERPVMRDLLNRLYDVRATEGIYAPGLLPSAELVNPDGPEAAREIERLRNALTDIANMPVTHESEKIFGEIARAALQPKE